MNCPKCNLRLEGGQSCPRCTARTSPAEPAEAIYPELAAFYAKYRKDPRCEICGATYPGSPEGILDGGHWIIEHWFENHPGRYQAHQQREER